MGGTRSTVSDSSRPRSGTEWIPSCPGPCREGCAQKVNSNGNPVTGVRSSKRLFMVRLACRWLALTCPKLSEPPSRNSLDGRGARLRQQFCKRHGAYQSTLSDILQASSEAISDVLNLNKAINRCRGVGRRWREPRRARAVPSEFRVYIARIRRTSKPDRVRAELRLARNPGVPRGYSTWVTPGIGCGYVPSGLGITGGSASQA